MPTVTRDPLSEPGIPRPNQAEYRETPISYRGTDFLQAIVLLLLFTQSTFFITDI